MLTLQLLRVRTRNGAIFPLFCTKEQDVELAKKIIQEFEQTWKNKENKAVLEDRISAIEESDAGSDYKLVRGFYALLERRCRFKSKDSNSDNDSETSSSTTTTIPIIDPPRIRKAVFEESSKRGFALTELERREIADSVASKLHLSSHDGVLKALWSDLDDNLILDYFDAIDPEALVGWYNLSLMQTLLFNCTKLDFYISGGSNWKHVLRSVKRLGLMYHLQQPQQQQENRIICSLEGPLSHFKLTDRYGTLLAKLLPSIIFSSDKKREGNGWGGEWHLDAWIVRKTMDGRKIYEFKISKNEIPELMTDPYSSFTSSSITEKELAGSSSSSSSFSSSLYNDYNNFDSAVEEKFAKRFEQAETGWRLIREPDPLVLSNGGALIPDFMFEKYDKKIYLEIVGFWTKEYLERKLQKLADIFVSVDSRKKKNNNEVISINDVAQKYCIPAEVVRRISLRDNREKYIEAGMYLIPKSKAHKLESLMTGTSRFIDACSILSKEGIPESCHAELIVKLGYDVSWQS